jgi:predicted aspartyl protease
MAFPALVALLLLIGCLHEPMRHCDPAAAATIPMSLDGTHPSIEVLIDGRTARMVLDTGADQIALSAAAAERLGLKQEAGSTPGFGAAAPISAFKTTIADLSVAGFHQHAQDAYVVPFPQEFHYDGVLGTPFLTAFVTTTDYQRRIFTLSPHQACETTRDGASIPIRLESGKLLVWATAGGVSGWFSVDTGAGNALTFFAPTVERLRLGDSLAPSVQMITGISAGGYTRGALVRLPEVKIGPHAFEQVLAELSLDAQGYFANSPHAGNLGGELWRRFTVTLDYRAGWMHLTPNDAFDDPFVGPRSGLAPSLADGVVKVVDVVAGSPAAEAGVRVGDTIVAVDGSVLDKNAIGVVVRALKAEPGTSVTLHLRDAAGAEREAELLLRELL